jgi:GAF domain-containing protein
MLNPTPKRLTLRDLRKHIPREMPPRTLASLAHALTLSDTSDAALSALGEALAEVDRFAHLALVEFDGRRGMLRDRALVVGDRIERVTLETTFDHLPPTERQVIDAGSRFVDFGDVSDEFARLLQLPALGEQGWLSVRGLRYEGHLAALLVLYESRKLFGARTSERFLPAIALFELAYLRFLDRSARQEAVQTLEDVTERVHGEYERRLSDLEARLLDASNSALSVDSARVVALERELAQAADDARRALKRAAAVDATVGSAVEQLEKAHIELHRRSESLRQKTRTIYLIDKVLTLDSATNDPRQLADGLLSLVGDDMHAHRCSLMLRSSDGESLYIGAARGVGPTIMQGTRVAIGTGVAGRVAATREPLLVRDVSEAKNHPLLHDQYFTTGSFISFPLVYHDELIGVVNLANRAMHGLFVEEDVDRVRLLGLVIALVASNARLPERLGEALSVR